MDNWRTGAYGFMGPPVSTSVNGMTAYGRAAYLSFSETTVHLVGKRRLVYYVGHVNGGSGHG